MKSKIFLSSVLAISALFSAASFAAPAADQQAKMAAAYKSNNIKQGLIGVCVDEQTKAGALKALSKEEVNKLCKCNVEYQGRMSQSLQWELQGAENAKDQKRFATAMQGFAKTEQPKFKACLGTALEAKLAKLQQQK